MHKCVLYLEVKMSSVFYEIVNLMYYPKMVPAGMLSG
jgi:hypothetical protein